MMSLLLLLSLAAADDGDAARTPTADEVRTAPLRPIPPLGTVPTVQAPASPYVFPGAPRPPPASTAPSAPPTLYTPHAPPRPIDRGVISSPPQAPSPGGAWEPPARIGPTWSAPGPTITPLPPRAQVITQVPPRPVVPGSLQPAPRVQVDRDGPAPPATLPYVAGPRPILAPRRADEPERPGDRPPAAAAPPSIHVHYQPWYVGWYCHPYVRYQHTTTVVVWFGFETWAWEWWWTPPSRAGWRWVPGQWTYAGWMPGHWQPTGRAPRGYAYVSGFWLGDVYVEGWWRREVRGADRAWIDGRYLREGGYVAGHWAPREPGPQGYVWEAGFWGGERWVDGFWRPESRRGFSWTAATYDGTGVYHAGHWRPVQQRPGHVWIPGWFDGTAWVDGYWVTDADYKAADLDAWDPDAAELPVRDGVDAAAPPDDDRPLGIPVH